MKNILSLLVCLCLICCFAGCKAENSSGDMENSSISNSSEAENSVSDNSVSASFNKIDLSEIKLKAVNQAETISLTDESEIWTGTTCEYNGQTITVSAPKFTGLPVNAVYSYKAGYFCYDGTFIFEVATDNGSMYLKIDKNGKAVDVNINYSIISAGRTYSRYSKQPDNITTVQTGEPGNYTYRLYSLDGQCISESYDFIGHFFNGLALIIKDKKVGLIDDNGTVVLAPSIPFDTIIYPPRIADFCPVFMTENAFVLPINGEFAVITISVD